MLWSATSVCNSRLNGILMYGFHMVTPYNVINCKTCNYNLPVHESQIHAIALKDFPTTKLTCPYPKRELPGLHAVLVHACDYKDNHARKQCHEGIKIK